MEAFAFYDNKYKNSILDKNATFKYCQGGEPIILVKFIGDGNTRK